VFVDLGCNAGAKEVLRTATDGGLPPDVAKTPGTLFLGGVDGKGVNALEMASAYATFAAKGVYAEPYSIHRVKDRRGRVVYEAKSSTRPVFEAKQVGVLNNPLQRVIKDRAGTGRGADIGRPVAGKTGTTQDNKDAWFIGYTPQLSTSVWVGFPDSRSMNNVRGRAVTGGAFPASIFGDVMKAALAGVKAEPLFTASPDDLDLEAINSTTTAPTTTSSSTTSTSTTTTPEETTSTTAPPATTAPGRTTTAPPQTTTTTSRRSTSTSTTSTTSTSTTSSTVQAQSGSSTTTTTSSR
jgi:membrane peptidoglycan carboxypeptidase